MRDESEAAEFEAHWSRHLLMANYLALVLLPWLGIVSIYLVTGAILPAAVGALYMGPVGVGAALLLRRTALASAMVVSPDDVALRVGARIFEVKDSDVEMVRVTAIPTGSLFWINFTVREHGERQWKWIVFVASDNTPVSALLSRGTTVQWFLGPGTGRM